MDILRISLSCRLMGWIFECLNCRSSSLDVLQCCHNCANKTGGLDHCRIPSQVIVIPGGIRYIQTLPCHCNNNKGICNMIHNHPYSFNSASFWYLPQPARIKLIRQVVKAFQLNTSIHRFRVFR